MKKVSIIVSLCSIQFYLVMQTVGQTEATFSSQASSEQIVSTAIVFPKTIQQLVITAKDHSSRATHLYESIINTTLNGSTSSELSDLLNNVLNEEHALKDEINSLHSIQEEMDSYYSQIHVLSKPERSSYEYVSEGYQVVKQLSLQINETINLQELKKTKSSIQKMLEESNKKVENNNKTQSHSKSVHNNTGSVQRDTEQVLSDTDSVQTPEPVQSDTNSVQTNTEPVQDTDSVQTNAEQVQVKTSDHSNNINQNE